MKPCCLFMRCTQQVAASPQLSFIPSLLYDTVITVNQGLTGFTEKDPANTVKIGVSILHKTQFVKCSDNKAILGTRLHLCRLKSLCISK